MFGVNCNRSCAERGKGLKELEKFGFLCSSVFCNLGGFVRCRYSSFFSAMDEITVKYGVSVMLQKERDEIMLLNVMVNEVVRI